MKPGAQLTLQLVRLCSLVCSLNISQYLIIILTMFPSACQLDLCTQYGSQAHHVFEREPRRPPPIAQGSQCTD